MATEGRDPDLKVLGHYQGYVIELRLAAPGDRPPPGTDAADLYPELAIAAAQLQSQIDRHIEYQRIAAQFEQGFLQPLMAQGFSSAKILDAIADFAQQAQWPDEVVKNLEYAAAALQDATGDRPTGSDPLTGSPGPSQRPLPPP